MLVYFASNAGCSRITCSHGMATVSTVALPAISTASQALQSFLYCFSLKMVYAKSKAVVFI